MNEKMTPESPLSPEESGEVEFNGFVGHVRQARNARKGKFEVIVTRKYPDTRMFEISCWGTLMEARSFALGVMQTMALFEDLISDGESLPLGIGERSGQGNQEEG